MECSPPEPSHVQASRGEGIWRGKEELEGLSVLSLTCYFFAHAPPPLFGATHSERHGSRTLRRASLPVGSLHHSNQCEPQLQQVAALEITWWLQFVQKQFGTPPFGSPFARGCTRPSKTKLRSSVWWGIIR